ncbi:MAG: hypothetical protein HC922_09720 [Leptolyngbyaceae cyanobacterium SM2_3_12]|nr:hypothetical protein [Leptolyngbyaceae cyanobacterium SM2_3_12]
MTFSAAGSAGIDWLFSGNTSLLASYGFTYLDYAAAAILALTYLPTAPESGLSSDLSKFRSLFETVSMKPKFITLSALAFYIAPARVIKRYGI